MGNFPYITSCECLHFKPCLPTETSLSSKNYDQMSADVHKLSFSDFILEKPLGKGTFGKVLLVRRRKKLFAMKILQKSDLFKNKMSESVLLEKRILQTNEHPFLVHLKFAFQTKSFFF